MAATTLSARSLPLDARPHRAPGAHVCRRDDGAIVLRRNGRYLKLSPRALEIWNAFDGELDLRELGLCFGTPGADATQPIAELVETLARCGLLVFEPDVRSNPHSPSVAAINAKNPLEAYITFSPEHAVDAIYLALRGLFTRSFGIVCTLVAGAGLAVFLGTPHVALVHREPLGIAAFAFALATAMLLHEAGHALTLRHFGGTVRRAGIGWYWFAPTAFVDTSDAHLLARSKRIAVCLAGPAVDLTVAGIAALACVCAPHGIAAWAWTFAATLYTIFLWNLNPLLELDWYYALTDLLERPNLRRDAFVQLLGRSWFGARVASVRRDYVGFLYGVCAIAYAAAYVVFVLPAVIRATLVAWLTPILPLSIVAVLPVGASIVAAAILLFTMLRAGAAGARGVRGFTQTPALRRWE